MQVAPTARVAAPVGQVVALTAKLLALAPLKLALPIAIGTCPVFVSVACCGALGTPTWLVKPRGEGVRVAEMVGVPLPVPERLIVEGESLALLAMTMLPV